LGFVEERWVAFLSSWLADGWGWFALLLGCVYINVTMEICMHHPIMAEEDSHPTKALFTTLKESFFSSQQSRAEESLLYKGGGRERESGGKSGSD